MSKNWTIYTEDGRIQGGALADESELALMLYSSNKKAIEGSFSASTHYIKFVGNEPVPTLLADDPPDWYITHATLKAELASLRFKVETGGISIAGNPIRTGRDDQAMLVSAYTTLKQGFAASLDWKGADAWTSFTLAQLEPIASAVGLHVQKCFSTERAVCEQIDLLTQAEVKTFNVVSAWNTAWGSL